MGTIELLKNMQEKCLNGGKYDDPLRMEKYQALEKAIKAIENQGKHEKVDGKTNELKNCPFCGGKVIVLNEIDITTMFKCGKCFSLFCFTGNKSKKESIELFNNRQDEFYKFSVYFLIFLTFASFIVELWRL